MRLTYTRPNDLSKLHDELLAAIPSLRPVGMTPRMIVEGAGEDIYLTVPSDADVSAIYAVVQAHDPTPRPQPPTLEERLEAAEGALLALMGV